MIISPDKLRTLRTEKSWSQEQLANASSLSLRTIQRIEKDGKCSSDTQIALASALNVPPNALTETPESTNHQPSSRWKNSLGISLTCLLIIGLLIVNQASSDLLDIPSIIMVLGLGLSLTAISSGADTTLRAYQQAGALFGKPIDVTQAQFSVAVIPRLIIHHYAGAIVTGLISLEVALSATPPVAASDLFLIFLLPLTYAVIANEMICRPLLFRLHQLIADSVSQNSAR